MPTDFGGPQPIDFRSPQPYNYNPSSLVPEMPNFDHAIRTAIGIADERQAKQDQDEASGIAQQLPQNGLQALLSDPDSMRSLQRMYQLNPKMAEFSVKLASAQDQAHLDVAGQEAKKASDFYEAFLSTDDQTARNKFLAQQIREARAAGRDTSKMEQMIGMTPDQQKLNALHAIAAAGEMKNFVELQTAQQMKRMQFSNAQLENTLKQQEIEANKRKANDADAGGMGNRAEIMFDRVKMAANEAAQAAQNIMERPIGQSSGFFGTMHPGTNILSAPLSALVNKMTPENVQGYNVMIAGVNRNLAGIEAAGLAPSGSLTHSMDAVQFKEGDTEMTKLRKMAEMRQIVEKGLESYATNPKVPQAQKDSLTQIINQMKDAVPFTHHDLTVLEQRQAKNPKASVQDIVNERLGRSGSGMQQAPFKEGSTATNPKTGDRMVYRNGQWVPM